MNLVQEKQTAVVEEKVLMTEREADMILGRVFDIGNMYDVESGEDFEWFYLYDLEEDDSVIGFITDYGHQVDVVQVNEGNGYAFNFWKNNYFYGQIVMNNTWEVTDVIKG